MNKRGFASDNNSGVHPEVFEAMLNVNNGHVVAYGDDRYTTSAISKIKETFGATAEVFFVFIGTAANVLGLKAATQTWNAIICAETAHINVDECGAPQYFTGARLLTIETSNGKLTIEGIQKHMHGFGFEHHSQPNVISITQATELGTLYSVEEIKAICDFAHQNKMYVHMDGARIANAAVALGKEFKEFTVDAGIDVLSFGGTKNGMMYGEAIVFFNKKLAENFKYTRKQGMQLASKMRFISAQFDAMLSNNLWKRNAAHANNMAKILEKEIRKLPEIKITQVVQANGVFAIVPEKIIQALQEEFFFYVWDEAKNEVRWMTSWDTEEEDIYGFVEKIKQLLNA